MFSLMLLLSLCCRAVFHQCVPVCYMPPCCLGQAALLASHEGSITHRWWSISLFWAHRVLALERTVCVSVCVWERAGVFCKNGINEVFVLLPDACSFYASQNVLVTWWLTSWKSRVQTPTGSKVVVVLHSLCSLHRPLPHPYSFVIH